MREEPVQNDLFDFFFTEIGGERSADEPAAFAHDGQVIIFRRTFAEQRFLGKPAKLHELGPLSRPELACSLHPLLGAPRDRCIHIVAA